MSPKPADLRAALQSSAKTGGASRAAAATLAPQEPAQTADRRDPHYRPGRSTKTNVTGYFSPSVKRQLRLMGAEQDRTIQDLLAEALNALFAAHGKPEIAERE